MNLLEGLGGQEEGVGGDFGAVADEGLLFCVVVMFCLDVGERRD